MSPRSRKRRLREFIVRSLSKTSWLLGSVEASLRSKLLASLGALGSKLDLRSPAFNNVDLVLAILTP